MAGLDGRGTALLRGDGGTPETFSAIANVTSVEGPGMERETIDVTAHDSPDGWMEFVGGLKDAGEVELELNYDPSEHDVLVADMDDEEPRNYQLVFPDGTTWSFAAILTEFSVEAPYDDKLTANVTYKVTGRPVLDGGS